MRGKRACKYGRDMRKNEDTWWSEGFCDLGMAKGMGKHEMFRGRSHGWLNDEYLKYLFSPMFCLGFSSFMR